MATTDRLSDLPDDLLSHILSNLSTKESVSTSLLSKRWRYLWKHVPALDLDSSIFEDEWDLNGFFDRFLEEYNENLDLKRFKWIYNVEEHHLHTDFVSRIDDVVKLGVCQFTFLNKVGAEDEDVQMPVSLYSCSTLVDLTLYCVVFDEPGSELVVSLPCLKTMHLEAVKFDGYSIFERLVSSCPVLNELIVVTHQNDYLGLVCVRSPSLRLFKLESLREDCEDPDVVIDAPRLGYMSVINYQPASFQIHSIDPSAKVNIDVGFDLEYGDPMIHNFLTAISAVREMTISARTLEEILDYYELDPLPQFANLMCLHAYFSETSLEMFPAILECCPNLHSLNLELDCLPETGENKLSFVPQCFKSSLRFVQLKIPTTVTKTSSKMQLAKYFLSKCVVLEKLMLNESFGNIINEVRKIPKRASGCEVVVMLEPAHEVVSHGSSLLPVIYKDMFIPKILDQ